MQPQSRGHPSAYWSPCLVSWWRRRLEAEQQSAATLSNDEGGTMASKYGILVGVTGRGENTAALRWAAQEAARSGRHLTLAHAVKSVLPPPPPSVLMIPEPTFEAGRTVVDDVGEELHGLTDVDLT